jgi:hypothetical protein
MSVVIDRPHELLGVPLVTVRNVLRAWRYGSSRRPYVIAQRSNVTLPSSTVTVLLHELRERGLIGLEASAANDGLTHAGLTFVAAARKQTTIDKSELPARRPLRPVCASLAEPIIQEWGWWTRVVAAPPIADNIKRNAVLARINSAAMGRSVSVPYRARRTAKVISLKRR